MVDLSLASSYVPAFVCILKSSVFCVLSIYLIPLGGFAGLCTLLVMDRVFLNSDFIIDVNAAVAAVLWSQISHYERHTKELRAPVFVAISVVWLAVAMHQLSRPGVFKPRFEVYAYAFLAILTTFTHQTVEPLYYSLLRTLAFDSAVLVQIYWQLSVAQEEPLILTIMRHGSILTAPPVMAMVATVSPILVIALQWKPTLPALPEETNDVEAAAVLREVLANRKEKSGN